MPAEDLEAISEVLTDAGRNGVTVQPPSQSHEFSFRDAYAVADVMHRSRIAEGHVPVGMKLGFTNRAIWDSLGLDAPFWSHVYASTTSGSPTISLDRLVQPKVEPEIVLGLGSDLDPGVPRAAVAAAVQWAAIGIEMVHCHYRDWSMTPPDAVADGGLHAALRFGPKVAMEPSLIASLAETSVEIECDGVKVGVGVGANALDGPLEAVCWLVGLPNFPGLRAGSVITTGTLTAALPAVSGQRWVVRATGPLDQTFALEIVD